MNQNEQEELIRTVITNIAESILANVPKLPESWDGFELSWYVCEKFRVATERSKHLDRLNSGLSGYSPRKTKRYKDFENEVLTRNL